MPSNPPIVLVDGSSYLYRAFHAMPPLTTSNGQPTGAIKGVLNMLRKLQADVKPLRMAVIFDAKGKTFRDDIFPEYKAQRPPMPDDLRAQIEPLYDCIRALGLPLISISGVEADDVIGTYCVEASRLGERVLVSTGDKDIAQLVNEHVTLINTMNDTLLDRDGVIEKFGLPPEQIVDYLTLVGDSVDNIPGVPKCGPKTALKWLDDYGSLDNLIAHADEIKGKVGENLRASLEQIPLSRQLATIKCDVPLAQGVMELQLENANTEKLVELYQQLEFKSWLHDLLGSNEAAGAHQNGASVSIASPTAESIPTQDGFAFEPENDYHTILDAAELERWVVRLLASDVFSVDTETTSLNYMDAELVGISFSLQAGEAAYVPVGHTAIGTPEQLPLDYVLNALKPILEAETPAKIGQNLKYDMNVLARYGITLSGVRFDTMLESYVLDAAATRHDMDSLALKYLGQKTIAFEDVAGKGAKQITFDQVPLLQAATYAAEDADVTLKLHQALWPRVQKTPTLTKVFQEIEMPLVGVLSRMEREGARIDVAALKQQSRQLGERMAELEAEAHTLAGQPFNLASPKQLGEILYDQLQLPILKKTPKGAPSTDESVLQDLAHDYELPKVLLEYRGCAKLKSTYTDKLPELVNPRTGRIHTSYHQAVASTGRLSSSDPNLQNIPIRNESGRKIRQAFIAEPGFTMVAADYSQIELRIMAHLSDDESLIDAFARGLDIHRATAAEVMGVPLEDVTSDMRRSAKAVNFGLIYGMSAFGLARQLGISREQAQAYMDRYFHRYPGVLRYMEDIRKQAHDQGYVETLFGRRLYLPEVRAASKMRRQAAERVAINAPMQGSAADIIKRAMIDIDTWLRTQPAKIRMIMQVHDELVFEVPNDVVPDAIEQIQKRMSGAASLKVPLIVEAGTGTNWEQAH
ncbi:DNA polymerase A [gamma proteobacterium HdN1]|nr:DNA polymerase A [gamma proteobacterium HdN1]